MQSYQPFSTHPEQQIASVSETELIKRIRIWLGKVCPSFPEGIGDDCAVTPLNSQDKYLLTTIDGVGWGKHFDEKVTPENVGRKLLARNLSDIASMGGIPRRAVVSLWLAPQVDLDWLARFYAGIASLAKEYEVDIVGGDVSAATEGVLIADLCLQGVSDLPLLRKQSVPGDSIWVTGSLGGSLLGKHYAFEPRVKEGQWLQKKRWAKSMIDLSDGLAKDLPSLVGGHVVRLLDLPISEAACRMEALDGRSAYSHAMSDGEDFELLFTLDASQDSAHFVTEWAAEFDLSLTCIGLIESISAESQFSLIDESGSKLEMGRGYEHF